MQLVILLFKLSVEKWMSMYVSVIEFLRFLLPTFLCNLPDFDPQLLLCKGWRLVVVVRCCGGTNIGTFASPPSYPAFPFLRMLWMNAALKSSGHEHLAGIGIGQSAVSATTTTTTVN